MSHAIKKLTEYTGFDLESPLLGICSVDITGQGSAMCRGTFPVCFEKILTSSQSCDISGRLLEKVKYGAVEPEGNLELHGECGHRTYALKESWLTSLA